MLKFNNSIVPNKVRIGWYFSSNKYAYRDVYSALKSIPLLGKQHIKMSGWCSATLDIFGRFGRKRH